MHSKKNKLAQLLLIGAAALGVSFASTSAVAKSVHIGSILSLTGPAAFLGEDMKAGMELAIEDINASGGILGKEVEWTYYDAESQTGKAINATRRLLFQDKVDILVGGGNMSGIAMAMAPIIERADRTFISTEGSTQIITPLKDRQNTFKSTVNDDQVLNRVFDYFEKKGVKKVALLADNSGFGQSAVEQTKKLSEERDFEILYESFNPNDTDLTPQLTRIKSQDVDAVIAWTVAPSGVVFIRQTDQLGFDGIIRVHSYGFVDQRYMELGGNAVKDLVLVSVKFPVAQDLPDADPVKNNILKLSARFEQTYGRKPNQYVAQTYDAIMLAREAIEQAGGDQKKISEKLTEISEFAGLSGVYNFSKEQHSGLSTSDIVILKYEDGQFRLEDY